MVAVATRQDVYRAEWMLQKIMATDAPYTVHGSTCILPPDIKFSELDHIQAYVNRVIDRVNDTLHPESRFRHGYPKVMTGKKTLCMKAYQQGNRIVLPQREVTDWAWKTTVVLHETAHFLTPCAGHNAEFTGMLAYLFEMAICPEAAFVYSTLLMESGMNPIRPEEVAA